MGGNDIATFIGSDAYEHFTGKPRYGSLHGGASYFEASGFRTTHAVGTPGGNDTAVLYDSPGDDVFHADPTHAFLQAASGEFSTQADNFRYLTAYSTPGGSDRAEFGPSPGADFFSATPAVASMVGPGFNNRALGFGNVSALGSAGGDDSARLYDGPGNDHLDAGPRHAVLSGAGFICQVDEFRTINVYATAGGTDTAAITASSRNDTLEAWPASVVLRDGGNESAASYRLRADGFDFVGVEGAGGTDSATLHDSAGADEFHGWPTFAFVQGRGFTNRVDHFRYVTASATAGGYDVARLFGSTGDEILDAQPAFAEMADAKAAKFSNIAQGFEAMIGDGLGGNDTANLSESDTQAMDDTLVAGATYARLADGVYSERDGAFSGNSYYVEVNNVRTVKAHVGHGVDIAYLYGSARDDVFEGRPGVFRLRSGKANKTKFDIQGYAFDQVFLRLGQGGTDAVGLYDSTGNDTLKVG
jgi:hypothetical protein